MKFKMRKYDLFGYLFLLPWFIGIVAFVFYPLVTSMRWSLSNIRVTGRGVVADFIGPANYYTILTTEIIFMERIYSFLGRVILSVPIILVFSLIIAMMLNADIRFKGFFRMLFFLPVIISSGPVMDRLINQGATSLALMDQYAMFTIMENILPVFIADPIIYIFRQIIMILWFSGVQILIFLAALQKLDPALYEASSIDGASAWENFWKITLPILVPILFVTSIYTVISLAVFDSNPIIDTIRNVMFNANMGYGIASAMAWIYAASIFILVAICYLLFREKPEKQIKETKRLSTYKQYLNRESHARAQIKLSGKAAIR